MAQIQVFISYTHVDNAALPGEAQGWVGRFQEVLEKLVPTRLTHGADVRFFRDPKLAKNDDLWKTLEHELVKSQIFLSVLSPPYVTSQSCLDELDAYIRHASEENRLQIGNKTTVMKVAKYPYEGSFKNDPVSQRLAGWLRKMLFYQFFETDAASGRSCELELEFQKQKYLNRLLEVADDVGNLVNALESKAALPGPAAAAVFLAETSPDLAAMRDAIRQDLKRRGYRVVPEADPPRGAGELEAEVTASLEGCRLAIHLIGKNDRFVGDSAAGGSMLALQYRLAAARRAAGLKQVVWVDDAARRSEEQFETRPFVEELIAENTPQASRDLLGGGLEELKSRIVERLADPKKPDAQPAALKRIYLVCRDEDREAVRPVSDMLFKAGFDVDYPLADGSKDAGELRLYHEDKLRMSAGALVYYGSAGSGWLDYHINELLKAPNLRDGARFPQVVYVGPPESEEKVKLQAHNPPIVKNFGAFQPELLQPFVSEVTAALKG